MNHIQNTIVVGDLRSIARGREAIDKSLVVCNPCLGSLEFATGCGPFTAVRVPSVKGVRGVQCYICEGRLFCGAGFRVTRVVESTIPV
jgi:hypothetical protein